VVYVCYSQELDLWGLGVYVCNGQELHQEGLGGILYSWYYCIQDKVWHQQYCLKEIYPNKQLKTKLNLQFLLCLTIYT
jgi:hypothetical protein